MLQTFQQVCGNLILATAPKYTFEEEDGLDNYLMYILNMDPER